MTDSAQIDDGRIIIDPKIWSTYNPEQTFNIEPFDTPPSVVQSAEDDYSPFSTDESNLDENYPHAPGLRAIRAMGRDV